MKTILNSLFVIFLISCAQKPTTEFEIYGRYDQVVGNLAVSSENRVFVSIHPFASPKYKVTEEVDGKLKPYPSAKVSASFANVIGLRVSQAGDLWILDMGGRLYGHNIKTNKKIKEISLKKQMTKTSFFQDFALDQKNNFAYIAEMSRGNLLGESRPGIISVNLKTGATKKFLSGHPSVDSDGSKMKIGDQVVTAKSGSGQFVPLRLGLNPITISSNFEFVYYGSMHGRKLYRIATQTLRDFSLTETEVENQVQVVGLKAVSDGISVDSKNNVYVTDVNSYGIGVTKPNGTYELLFSNPEKIIWPDGFSCGGDGMMYFTINQLHLNAALNRGQQLAKAPFTIGRFKPLAPCEVGR
ncbi:MAG: L-dopachrome tautomerase-related protein [Pseudomonadota bacterium]